MNFEYPCTHKDLRLFNLTLHLNDDGGC